MTQKPSFEVAVTQRLDRHEVVFRRIAEYVVNLQEYVHQLPMSGELGENIQAEFRKIYDAIDEIERKQITDRQYTQMFTLVLTNLNAINQKLGLPSPAEYGNYIDSSPSPTFVQVSEKINFRQSEYSPQADQTEQTADRQTKQTALVEFIRQLKLQNPQISLRQIVDVLARRKGIKIGKDKVAEIIHGLRQRGQLP